MKYLSLIYYSASQTATGASFFLSVEYEVHWKQILGHIHPQCSIHWWSVKEQKLFRTHWQWQKSVLSKEVSIGRKLGELQILDKHNRFQKDRNQGSYGGFSYLNVSFSPCLNMLYISVSFWTLALSLSFLFPSAFVFWVIASSVQCLFLALLLRGQYIMLIVKSGPVTG